MTDSSATASPPPDQHGTQGWWGLDSDPSAAAWMSPGNTHLDNLLSVPRSDGKRSEALAWVRGYELNINGYGRVVSKERRRYTLLGHDGYYLNQIGGHQTINADSQCTRVAKHRLVNVGKSGDTAGMSTAWGRDRLTVSGNASYEFGSRTLMMAGSVERNWNGGIMRLASMEGVVCGGAMTRVIAGPSMTLSGMMTGDVYIGIVRAAAVRNYLAVLQYRAASKAAWAVGQYTRMATFVIEPLVGVPMDGMPVSNIAGKMSRLQKLAAKATRAMRAIARTRVIQAGAKVVKGAKMVCPVVDIMAGLVMLPAALFGLFSLFKAFKAAAILLPPTGPPRLRSRTVGVTKQLYGSMTYL